MQVGPGFLAGGGEMGGLMRAHDWSATALGSPESWPQSLKTTVRLVLSSGHPMLIWWGPDLVQFYNDAYLPSVIPDRHPSALGQKGQECWLEIWDVVGPQIEQVMAGLGPTWHENQLVPIIRNGRLEDAYWTYSFNPIDEPGAPNGVGGVLLVSQETTAVVLAEQRRAADAERQRFLFERAPGFTTILRGPDLVFEFVNETYARMFGGRDFIGRTVREVFPDLAGQGYYELLERVYATGERFIAEHTPIRLQASPDAGAEEFFLDFIYEPVRDETGEVSGLFIHGHDVTAAHVAHEAMRVRERRHEFWIALDEALRHLADPREVMATASERLGRHLRAGRCGYSEIDPTGIFITVERDWTDGTLPTAAGRWRLEDFPSTLTADYRAGRTVRLDDVRGDPRVSQAAAAAYAAVGIGAQLSVPLVKDGRLVAGLFVHRARAHPWTDEDEALVRAVAERTWSEVERARAETLLRELNATLEQRIEERIEAARQSEARFRGIFDSTYQLIGLIGLDGTILEVNRAFLDAVGAETSAVVGLPIWDAAWFCRTPEAVAALKAAFPTVAAGRFFRTEFHLLLPDDRVRSYDFSLSPGRDDADRVVFIVAEGRDITDLRAMEAHLRQSQKMEAVGQLTGGIAHDFNNMLQAIRSGLEMARRRVEGDRARDALAFMGDAVKGVDRAAALTQRLLAFARRQVLNAKPVMADALILGMVELIQRIVGSAITVRTQMDDGQWPVMCDANQVENAILNLAINARDAMPDGGILTLATRDVRLSSAELAGQDEVEPGDFVEISVTDTGTGMTPEVLTHAFEPFYTTKPIGQGTGLGLSQIYGFVRQSGGLVRLESSPDRGTTMRLFLPRHLQGAAVQPTQAPSQDDKSEGAGKVVVLVEDAEGVRELIAEALREQGYIVLDAEDGPAALRLFAGHVRVDILVTDVGLPGMNGRQVAEAARERWPGLPVLFITGYAGSMLDGQLARGMEVISKPFTLDALAAKLGRMAETSSSLPPT